MLQSLLIGQLITSPFSLLSSKYANISTSWFLVTFIADIKTVHYIHVHRDKQTSWCWSLFCSPVSLIMYIVTSHKKKLPVHVFRCWSFDCIQWNGQGVFWSFQCHITWNCLSCPNLVICRSWFGSGNCKLLCSYMYVTQYCHLLQVHNIVNSSQICYWNTPIFFQLTLSLA